MDPPHAVWTESLLSNRKDLIAACTTRWIDCLQDEFHYRFDFWFFSQYITPHHFYKSDLLLPTCPTTIQGGLRDVNEFSLGSAMYLEMCKAR